MIKKLRNINSEKTCVIFTMDGVVNSLARSTTNGTASKAFAQDGGEAVDQRESCSDVV
jgi:hypothetical protein